MYMVMSMFMDVGMISSYVHGSTPVATCIYVLVFGVVYVHGVDVIWWSGGSSPPGTAPVTHKQQLDTHIPQLVLSGWCCPFGLVVLVC